MIKPIAKFTVTDKQRAWVDKQVAETGESQASIMRGLIQEKVNKTKRATR